MRKTTFSATCLTALLSAFCFSAANAQTGQSGSTGADTGSSHDGTSSGSKHDDMSSQDFVKHAAQANLAEIKVSQLALEKAQSPDVKQFAQKMIDDHTKASSELAQLAMSKNLKVPDDTDMMHKASMKMLQAKSGDSFDSAYMEQMNKDQQKVIDMFQSASTSHKVDKDLQAFASKTLPKLQQHHQLVAQVESKMPSMSASKKSSSSNR
jgi:putative membrane protein